MKFKVIREHLGDKFYRSGDVREANERDVKHLIKKGVLVALPAVSEAEVVDDLATSVTAGLQGADDGAADANQSAQTAEDPSLSKQAEPAKSDDGHKNKAEPAAPKNKGA